VLSEPRGEQKLLPVLERFSERRRVASEFEKSSREHPPIAPGTPDPYQPAKVK